MNIMRSVGHILLGAIFISGGADALLKPEPRAALVAKSGMVSDSEKAKQATILNGAMMVVGGTALALNLLPKWAAVLLAALLIPTTLVGHPYWKEADPASRANQQVQFLKNLSTLGGLLLVLTERDGGAEHEERGGRG
jgi:putative oxidoreductase